MAKSIGGNINSTDTATTTTVALNASTSTKILDALVAGAQNHIKIFVDNPAAIDVIIKFQAASVDDLKEGMTIAKGEGKTILELPNVYRGEISAIAAANAPTLTIIRQ